METDIGANEQGFAAPAGSEESQASDYSSENTAGAADRQDARDPMPMEDRSAARQARLRERAEGEARLRAATERQDAYARSRGYQNFAQMAETEQAKPSAPPQDSAALEARLRELVNTELGNNPLLASAREMTERAAVESSKQTLQQEMREFLASPDYAKSGIKSFADLVKMPGYDRFYDLVANKGLTLADAYELVNRQGLLRDRAEAARQAALNSVFGKRHLQGAEGAGDGGSGMPVPEDVMEWYSQMNPKMTKRQIMDHYTSFLLRQDET